MIPQNLELRLFRSYGSRHIKRIHVRYAICISGDPLAAIIRVGIGNPQAETIWIFARHPLRSVERIPQQPGMLLDTFNMIVRGLAVAEDIAKQLKVRIAILHKHNPAAADLNTNNDFCDRSPEQLPSSASHFIALSNRARRLPVDRCIAQ